MQPLSGKVAIITGGGGTVGRGVTAALADAGADVAVMDVDGGNAERASARAREAGRRALALAVDLTDRSAAADSVQHVAAALGGVDILVNLAQRFRNLIDFVDVTEDDMMACWESGPMTTLRMMQLCYPHLVERGGAIVNFGSGVGISGTPRYAAYASAKEAIRALTRVAAQEWGPRGITVNTVCPVATDDPANASWASGGLLGRVPLRRMGDPYHDIGAAVVYLSGAGSYVTGQTLMVDGGLSLVV